MKIGPINIHSRALLRTKRRPQPPEFLAPFTPCNIPTQRCRVSRDLASKRILIMRVGAFGDILMGTPLLAALRKAYPDAHLTWIAEFSEREAIDANPYIDEILRWDGSYWKRMVRKTQYQSWLKSVFSFRRELVRRRYDVFISFQPEEWPLLLLGTGAPVTIGIFDTFKRYYRSSRRAYYRHLYSHSYAEPGLPSHRVDQYLLALEALGLPPAPQEAMSMGYTAGDAAVVDEFLHKHGLTFRRFVVLSPMTTWPTKCWPSERFAALGDALTRRYGFRVLVTGSAKERPALEDIASCMEEPPVVAAGDLSFRQIAALVSRAALVVSGDTGPMHVASALETPQIALFGPTAPQWYGPRSGHALSLIHPVPCGPCDQKVCPNTGQDHMKCMRLISVEEVLNAAEALLKEEVPA